MPLPNYKPAEEFPIIPEGLYTFQIKEDPKVMRARSGKGTYILMHFFATRHETDERLDHTQTFVKWQPPYSDMLLALGGKQDENGEIHTGSIGNPIGKRFDAEIEHIPDSDNPNRKRAKICNVLIPPENQPASQGPYTAPTDETDVPPPKKIPEEDKMPF